MYKFGCIADYVFSERERERECVSVCVCVCVCYIPILLNKDVSVQFTRMSKQ